MAQSSFNGFTSNRPNKSGTNTGDATATAADILSGKTAYGALGKLMGTLVQGKKFATGTGTLAKPSEYKLTVTGLTFQPSTVLIFQSGTGGYFSVYSALNNSNVFYSQSDDVVPTGSRFSANGAYSNLADPTNGGSVSATGFTLPVAIGTATPTPVGSYTWIAYE